MNQMMRHAAVAAFTTLTIAGISQAAVLYDSNGFETVSGGFVAGNIVGQTAGTPPKTWVQSTTGTAPTAVVQSTVVNEGTQAVQLTRPGGGDGFFGPNGLVTPITDPTNTQRYIDISWSMTVEDVGDDLAGFFGVSALLNLDGSTTTNRIVSFGVDASDPTGTGTGEVLYFYDNGVFGVFTDGAGDAVEVPLSTNSWFDFVLRIDTQEDDAVFMLGDGTTMTTLGTAALGGAVTQFTTGVLSTDNQTANVSVSGVAYYDEFVIDVVAIPEPAGLALLGMVGAGLIRRRNA